MVMMENNTGTLIKIIRPQLLITRDMQGMKIEMITMRNQIPLASKPRLIAIFEITPPAATIAVIADAINTGTTWF
jgi:hypothetical protein